MQERNLHSQGTLLLTLSISLFATLQRAVINGPAKQLLLQIGAIKRRGRDARILVSLIYFFESFCIHYIPLNYVIPQAMPPL